MDRCHQQRVRHALELERDTRFEPRSYGFRPLPTVATIAATGEDDLDDDADTDPMLASYPVDDIG